MQKIKFCVRKILVTVLIFALISQAVPLNVFAESVLNGGMSDGEFVSLSDEVSSLVIWDGTVAGSFAGGDGSKDNPYQIETAMQLAKLADDSTDDKHYVLTRDIYFNDVESEKWYTEDNVNSWTSIENFNGTFDGQGHSIYGLYGGGLFGTASGIIQNICLKDSYVFSGAEIYVGGIAGYASKISGCSSSGIIEVISADSLIVGGIAGYASEISGCYNEGIVRVTGASTDSRIAAGGIVGIADVITKCSNEGDVFASVVGGMKNILHQEYVGGIAGIADVISQCSNRGNITAESSQLCGITAGGIVGDGAVEVSECYNVGSISVTRMNNSYPCVGGILGSTLVETKINNCYDLGISENNYYYCGGVIGLTYNFHPPILANCYCLTSRVVGKNASTHYGKYSAVSCNTLTENEMKQKISFEGFDFENIWNISGKINGGYPTLAWERRENDIEGDIEEPNISRPALRYSVFAAEELSYNDDTGYNVEQFNLYVLAGYVNTDDISYENCILTIELPEGLSFAENENIRTLSETIECINETNSEVFFIYPVYIAISDYVDEFEITISCSADGYEELQSYSQAFEVSMEKEISNIVVWTTEKSLSVKTGDSMQLAFGMYDAEADEFSEWKKMAVVVSDPTIIGLSEYKETKYGYSLKIIGKKQGSTNVVITDASTGKCLTMRISVYDQYVKTYSYDIDNMPSFYPDTSITESKIETNIYDLNGLFVNNYSAVKNQDTNKYTVSFDAYNINHYYGAVDIYDQNGNWVDYEEIDKFSYSTSAWEAGEQAYYLITDFFDGKFQTYELKTYSKHTPISFELPENGYFTISNNVATSPGTYFANAFEILFDASMTALGLAMSDDVKKTAFSEFEDELKKKLMEQMVDIFVDKALESENLQKVFLNTLESEIRKVTKKVAKAEGNYILSSSNNMYSSMVNLAEDILSSFEIGWKTELQTACNIGESIITELSGPAGLALEGCFALNEGADKLVMAVQMALSTDDAYATVYSDTEGSNINQNGIVINSTGNIDAEAVLQTFRISNNDAVDVILDNENPLETYELYNICLIKNDQLVQPNGKVEVYVPIPDGMNGNTCKIFRQEADGEWTILDAHKEGNYLVFETDHFSLYAIIGENKNISIYSLPFNTTYNKDDMLDTEGLVVDMEGTLVSEGFICTPNVLSNCGIQKITVIYGSTTTEFDVMVNHIGGTATCIAKAVCSECGEEYGEKDEDNHETDGWTTDELYHWHICSYGSCGAEYDIERHYDTVEDGKCDICSYEISTLIPNPSVTDFVSRLYTVILNREADKEGLAEWTDYLENGVFTGAEVAQGFIMSDEFLNKEMTNEEFVQILYSAFFGREADPDGFAEWVDLLNQGFRKSYIFAGFANSNEFKTLCEGYGVNAGSVHVTVSEQQPNLSDEDYNVWLFVERMYTEVLDRTPDMQGIEEWVALLKAGTMTGAEVAEGFILSEEFLAKEISNEEYVRTMYNAFFGREADPDGLAEWVNALETNYTKEFVFAGFANSDEFGVLCETYGITQGSMNVPEL